MKLVRNDKKKQGISYPCLMTGELTGIIVLMATESIGIVVCEGNPVHNQCLGYYNKDWSMNLLKPYTGSVTLSND